MNDEDIKVFIHSPSVSAVAYQAQALIDDLYRITREEYPKEACTIRNVLLSYADFILRELELTYDHNAPYGTVDPDVSDRVRALAQAVHKLQQCVRYLHASSPLHTPPGIQVILSQLTRRYFPSENGPPVCLVRPQWKYNLTFVPLSSYLTERVIPPEVLDLDGKLGVTEPEQLTGKLWDAWYLRINALEKGRLDATAEAPRQLGVLSFARLDTDDSLLYPLLAHELGHFIDFSYRNPLHLSDPIKTASAVKQSEVHDVLRTIGGAEPSNQEVRKEWNRVTQATSICVRELLADILATRMMGLAFFAAHSEFLKTIAPWPSM